MFKLIDVLSEEVYLLCGYSNQNNDKQKIVVHEILKKNLLTVPDLKKRPFKLIIEDNHFITDRFVKITKTGRFFELKRKGNAVLEIEDIYNLDVLGMIDQLRGV